MININLTGINKVFVLEDTMERIGFFQKFLEGKEVLYTDDADLAIMDLIKTKFDLIFLDHDLDDTDALADPRTASFKTGLDVIRCLRGSINEETPVVIHSINPVGAANMVKEHPFNVVHIPFHLLLKVLDDHTDAA